MANGDITTIKHLSRVALPGGGHTALGAYKQNKVMITGEIVATYVSTGIALNGESGGFKALGADTMDFISFQVLTVDQAMADDALYFTKLSHSTNKIFMIEDVGAADSAAPGDGDDITLRYVLVGDEHAADLT